MRRSRTTRRGATSHDEPGTWTKLACMISSMRACLGHIQVCAMRVASIEVRLARIQP